METGFQHSESVFVLRPGQTGPKFSHVPKDTHFRRSDERLKPDGTFYPKSVPWLIGKITYESVFGKTHYTNFCFRGRSDGTSEEYGGAPYNERT